MKRGHIPVSDIGNPEEQLERKTRQEELEEVLALLPERMRTILYLREIQGFTYKELQTAMNLSEGQVKIVLHRARETFRQYDLKLSGRRRGHEDERR